MSEKQLWDVLLILIFLSHIIPSHHQMRHSSVCTLSHSKNMAWSAGGWSRAMAVLWTLAHLKLKGCYQPLSCMIPLLFLFLFLCISFYIEIVPAEWCYFRYRCGFETFVVCTVTTTTCFSEALLQFFSVYTSEANSIILCVITWTTECLVYSGMRYKNKSIVLTGSINFIFSYLISWPLSAGGVLMSWFLLVLFIFIILLVLSRFYAVCCYHCNTLHINL